MPVVLKVVRVTDAAFASPWTNCYCTPLFSHTHYWYKVRILKIRHDHCCTAVLFCGPVSPRLTPVQVYRFKVHGTKSEVLSQNIITAVLLLYCGPVFPARLIHVCVCVFSSHSFWTSTSLDVPAGVTQEEGPTEFLIHLLSAVRALIFLARRIQSFLSLVDREVKFCVLTI